MKSRKAMLSGILTLWLLSTLLLPSGAPFRANSVEGLASPHFFRLVHWEASKLRSELAARISSRGGDLAPADRQNIALVESYFRLAAEVRDLQASLARLNSVRPADTAEGKLLETRLEALRRGRANLTDRVKTILARQIGQAMTEEGISPLPPIVFAFDTPPQLLVISPRERIDLEKTLLLEPGLSAAAGADLERRVEGLPPAEGSRWGVSVLVEELGGLALYPSLIPETDSLESAVPTIAHEWVHHYLFFRPLGQRYGTSSEMTTINETVADIVGNEIGDRVLKEYGKTIERRQPRARSGFDFTAEMRQTRLKVDELLGQSKVLEAESYMEERRQLFVKNGYHLRRLNQAYFAFHGSYGDAPASVSPVAGWLRAIRSRSGSLGEFLRTVARITSYGELEGMASTLTDRSR